MCTVSLIMLRGGGKGEERTSLFSLDPHQRQPLWLGYKSTHTQWTFHFCMFNQYFIERLDPLNSCPKIKSVNVICLCNVHSVLSYIVQVPV